MEENNLDEWADISDKDIEKYETLVEKYGAFLNETQIKKKFRKR